MCRVTLPAAQTFKFLLFPLASRCAIHCTAFSNILRLPVFLAHEKRMQYLLRRRIGEAQTLLISTDLPVTTIAGMVGYDTQSYFNLQFSKNVGMPPKKYRQNYLVETRQPEKKRRKKKKES